MRQRVLIVEDDAPARKGMADLLSLWGYEVTTASDGAEALERVAEESPAVVVSDLVMPGMDGLALLSALRVDHPEITVIMLTGQGSIESAVQAMKEGAYDYLTKPLDPARLQILLERALDRTESAREVHRLRRELRHRGAFGRLVAGTPAMQEVTRQIEQVAPTDATVLVLGESGTGKELVARTIHDHSARRRGPFVAVNCAAIPETLLESEIFGHERGSFTGATGRRPGCFELADGGTLFLDEIGNVPPAQQARLLRALETGEFERVGSSRTQRADVRVVSATNADLPSMIRDGRFREDLLFRINTVEIRIPPLRERREEILELANAQLEKKAQQYGRTVKGFDPTALLALQQYAWPGNVRELNSVVERSLLLTAGEEVGVADLRLSAVRAGPPSLEEMSLEDAERALIRSAIKRNGGSVQAAAEALGLSRSAMYRRLEKLGLKADEF